MAHEAHHDSHHTQADTRPTTSSRAAFWFIIIMAGLFVAAVNFVNVMSHDEEGHGAGGHNTEHTTEHGAAAHEATPAHAAEAQGTEHAEGAVADTTHTHEAAAH